MLNQAELLVTSLVLSVVTLSKATITTCVPQYYFENSIGQRVENDLMVGTLLNFDISSCYPNTHVASIKVKPQYGRSEQDQNQGHIRMHDVDPGNAQTFNFTVNIKDPRTCRIEQNNFTYLYQPPKNINNEQTFNHVNCVLVALFMLPIGMLLILVGIMLPENTQKAVKVTVRKAIMRCFGEDTLPSEDPRELEQM